jgi:hypothetical protein
LRGSIAGKISRSGEQKLIMAKKKIKDFLIEERDRTDGLFSYEVLLSIYDDGSLEIIRLNIYAEAGTITNADNIKIPLSKFKID